MRVLQIGNFRPPHSTENHLKRAMENNGLMVEAVQEDAPNGGAFVDVTEALHVNHCDFVLWTRTGWGWENPTVAAFNQRRMLRRARDIGIPVVGYHLDIWWGLKREHQIYEDPFFEVDLLITADGGHADNWERAGINHVWFPPGVSEGECEIGMFRDEFRSEIAFVGSHDGSYHPEHEHRHQLVRWLRRTYGDRCKFYPQPGHHAVRGKDLQDLYASVDVLVGDSCFAGTGLANYWSDRIPETLGRGGFLIHPYVEGIEDHFKVESKHNMRYVGEQMWTWEAGDWETLASQIHVALNSPRDIANIRLSAREHVLANHTYEVRMRQLVELLQERDML